jgi:hypothetical protein
VGPFRQDPPLTAAGRADDEYFLAALAKDYGPLGKPRHWIHFLYVADERAATEAKQRVEAAGWQVDSVDAATQRPGWLVIAEQPDVSLSAAAVREARHFFEGVAAAVPGGDYDGWLTRG